MIWISSITSRRCSASRPKSTGGARSSGIEIDNGQAIAVFVSPWSTGQRDNVSRRMVYRIAAMERSRTSSRLTCKPDRARRRDQATQAFQLALGLPAPAILFAIEPLSCDRDDRPQSYPAAVTALLRDSWPFVDRGLRSGDRPGHHGLADEVVRSAYPARADRLGRSLCSFSVCRLTWAFGSFAAGRSGSRVRIATLRLPATVWRARSAELRFPDPVPERNRDLRLKRWWRTR